MVLDIYRLFIYSQLHPVQRGPGAVVVQPGVALLVHRHAAVSAHVRLTKNICTTLKIFHCGRGKMSPACPASKESTSNTRGTGFR